MLKNVEGCMKEACMLVRSVSTRVEPAFLETCFATVSSFILASTYPSVDSFSFPEPPTAKRRGSEVKLACTAERRRGGVRGSSDGVEAKLKLLSAGGGVPSSSDFASLKELPAESR